MTPQNKVLSCNLQNMGFISTSTPCPKTTPVSFRSAQWPHKILHTLPLALCPQQNIPRNPTKMSVFSLSPMTRKQCYVRFPQLHNSQNKVLPCNFKNMGFISTSTSRPKIIPVSFCSASGLTKYWFHFPRPCDPNKIRASFPWPHGPKTLMCMKH